MNAPSLRLAHCADVLVEDAPRTVLHTALAELGESAEAVSLALGLPRNYLRLYLEQRGTRTLPPVTRRRLATYLGVPDSALR